MYAYGGTRTITTSYPLTFSFFDKKNGKMEKARAVASIAASRGRRVVSEIIIMSFFSSRKQSPLIQLRERLVRLQDCSGKK